MDSPGTRQSWTACATYASKPLNGAWAASGVAMLSRRTQGVIFMEFRIQRSGLRLHIVVGRDDLPAASPLHPHVGKPIAPLEPALAPPLPHHQPAGDDDRRAELVHLHGFVVRPG